MADDPRVIVPVANHLFSLNTLHEAERLAKHAPHQVTDEHLAHLAHYVSARELTALIHRRAEAVQRRADQAFADAQQRTADARAAASTVHTSADAAYTPVFWGELVTQHGHVAMTLAHVDAMVGPVLKSFQTFIKDMNERNKERNAKIAALEAALQKVQERVLELEAQKAVADGKP